MHPPIYSADCEQERLACSYVVASSRNEGRRHENDVKKPEQIQIPRVGLLRCRVETWKMRCGHGFVTNAVSSVVQTIK